MTALNCFVTADAIHISTDGAGYLADGTPFGHGQKVSLLAHLPAVLAIRGPVNLVHFLGAGVCASCQTFDELLAAAPGLFQTAFGQYRSDIEARGLGSAAAREVDFVIAGYSASRERLEAYAMQDRTWPGGEAWTLCQIPDDLISPIGEDVGRVIGEMAAEPGEPLQVPEIAAIRIMEAQRAIMFRMESGKSISPVGAFCQLTTLRRDSITTEIVKRWN